MPTPQPPAHRHDAALLACAGALSLAAAMGVGRFAFTPLLPLMQRAGQLDAPAASWLAAANYLGYFLGAMGAARLGLPPARLAFGALAVIALATAAMGAVDGVAAWAVLRFVAGAASACAFVGTSVWCLGALAALAQPARGGTVFAGVGVGIAATGLVCLAAAKAGLAPPVQWLLLGGLAAALALAAAALRRGRRVQPALSTAQPVPGGALPPGTHGLVVCYGLMGLGYILPATYLPVLARAVVDDPAVFGWAWPVFGAMAATSTLAAGALLRRAARRQLWAAAQALMALGVLLPALSRGGGAVAASAVLVGGTFMVVTLFGMQEARERAAAAGADPQALAGRMTAAFALGQIAGPLLASALAIWWPAPLPAALAVGAALLAGSAAWLARSANASNPTSR